MIPPATTVLLTRFSALGDVAMTIPVVYSACTAFPDTRFVLLTRPAMASIFVNSPANLTVVGVDVKAPEYSGINGLRRLSKEIKQLYHPELYIDLHNVLRTKILGGWLRLAGVPSVSLYKPREERRALTRRHYKAMTSIRSQLERYRDTFSAAGLDFPETFSGLYGGRCKAPVEIFSAITTPRVDGERWVGIAPFAAHPGKVYPPQMMEEVVRMLQAEADAGLNLRIFLFGGGAEEQRILEAWEASYPAATSLAGKRYGFPAELALMNHLDVMVSMDSANMHLAAIADAPTLSIWGSTHPYCGFLPWRQAEDNCIQAVLECRPCSVYGNKPCHRGDFLCMRSIQPSQIFDKIISRL